MKEHMPLPLKHEKCKILPPQGSQLITPRARRDGHRRRRRE